MTTRDGRRPAAAGLLGVLRAQFLAPIAAASRAYRWQSRTREYDAVKTVLQVDGGSERSRFPPVEQISAARRDTDGKAFPPAHRSVAAMIAGPFSAERLPSRAISTHHDSDHVRGSYRWAGGVDGRVTQS